MITQVSKQVLPESTSTTNSVQKSQNHQANQKQVQIPQIWNCRETKAFYDKNVDYQTCYHDLQK